MNKRKGEDKLGRGKMAGGTETEEGEGNIKKEGNEEERRQAEQ